MIQGITAHNAVIPFFLSHVDKTKIMFALLILSLNTPVFYGCFVKYLLINM